MISCTLKEFKKDYMSMPLKELAKKLQVSVGTICNYAKRHNIAKGKGNRTKRANLVK